MGEDWHVGEVGWQVFRGSMMSQLPHAWFYREDTHLSIQHFRKQPASARAAPVSDEDAAQTKSNPNVVVAHLSDGVQVVHMYTGRPLTHIALADSILYDDTNADGVIEDVRATSDPGTVRDQCVGVSLAGLPSTAKMFNVSICEPRASGLFDRLFNPRSRPNRESRGRGRSNIGTKLFAPVRAANPISLSRRGRSSDQQEKDVLFLVSTGRLTSFRSRGQLNWMIDTIAQWPTAQSFTGSSSRSQPSTDVSPVKPSLQVTVPREYPFIHLCFEISLFWAGVACLCG